MPKDLEGFCRYVEICPGRNTNCFEDKTRGCYLYQKYQMRKYHQDGVAFICECKYSKYLDGILKKALANQITESEEKEFYVVLEKIRYQNKEAYRILKENYIIALNHSEKERKRFERPWPDDLKP